MTSLEQDGDAVAKVDEHLSELRLAVQIGPRRQKRAFARRPYALRAEAIRVGSFPASANPLRLP